jgi:hypothetical protein
MHENLKTSNEKLAQFAAPSIAIALFFVKYLRSTKSKITHLIKMIAAH